MPIFEYRCRDCGHQFEKLVSRTQQPVCPVCQSLELEQLLSVFAVASPSAAKLKSAATDPCGTCGDPRGPGSCKLN